MEYTLKKIGSIKSIKLPKKKFWGRDLIAKKLEERRQKKNNQNVVKRKKRRRKSHTVRNVLVAFMGIYFICMFLNLTLKNQKSLNLNRAADNENPIYAVKHMIGNSQDEKSPAINVGIATIKNVVPNSSTASFKDVSSYINSKYQRIGTEMIMIVIIIIFYSFPFIIWLKNSQL